MEKIIRDLVDKNYSIPQIQKETNLSYNGVRYWLRKLKIRTKYKENLKKWKKENLLNAINRSNCHSDILRNIGLKINSGNFQTLNRYCKSYGIDIRNLKLNYDFSKSSGRNRMKDEDVYVENSTYTSTYHLKNRLIKSGILKDECCKCGNKGEWMGQELALQLDHKNGIRDDNRIKNLRILCPNCHSQTKTYSGKKLKK